MLGNWAGMLFGVDHLLEAGARRGPGAAEDRVVAWQGGDARVRESGSPGVRESGSPGVRESGSPGVRESGSRAWEVSGVGTWRECLGLGLGEWGRGARACERVRWRVGCGEVVRWVTGS
ncbi:hypothetical protein GCM10009634_83790 [Saccharothrix xinjiangensis]